MQQGDDTVREDEATVREDGTTVRESGATVRESGATVREAGGSSSPSATPAQEQQAPGWLPSDLATNYRMIESLPALGGEADLYVVGPRDAQFKPRFVAKVYRQGIPAKEDVLSRVKEAEPAHIVRLEAYGQDDATGRWWELMEYVEQGSLRQLLEREGPKLPDALIRDILRQLNNALASLHRLSLEHRDLKPANVLVRSRTPLDLVLIDFGIASVVEATMHFTGRAQTMKYAPPEALGSAVSDENRNTVVIDRTKWDYWSLGMMLVEMLRGKHPYEGFDELIIGRELLTQNVDDLTADVADPSWQKLCRGLLRRTPTDRWDGAAVSKWLANPNDPSLTVAEEVAAPQPSAEPPTPTIDFDGARYATPEALGLALAEDWAKAESFWMRRFPDVRNWVTDGLGLQPMGDAMAAIDDDAELSLEVQVFNFVYLLAPNAPTVRFRNVDLSIEGLAELGQRAVTGQDADARPTLRTSYDVAVERSTGTGQDASRATLLTLYRQGILLLAGALPGREALAEVARRWNDAVSNYERLQAEYSAQGITVPELDDDDLVVLLAGGIPVPSVLASLRQEAQRASTKDARACPWFRALGTPEDMSVAMLAILPHLQAPAEQQGRVFRTRPLRGCVGGIFVGGLFGLQVMWAHNFIIFMHSGPEPFLTAILGAGVAFAFYRAVVWDLRGTEGRVQEDRAQTTGLRRRIGRISDGIGCLILIALPFAAILMLGLLTILVGVSALPSLLAMNMIGLIDFGIESDWGVGRYRDFRGDVPGGLSNPLFNPLLYVVPHALLGAIVGLWARRRKVITISILALVVLIVVVNWANPTHFLTML